ncbi:hypothetical protein F4775DRAFT_83448 [Biscogniauxia sp. FL1348]|nr:hypothetical protein F4775DRAFT_83448 [Biscogniauxia sp. FL1348]
MERPLRSTCKYHQPQMMKYYNSARPRQRLSHRVGREGWLFKSLEHAQWHARKYPDHCKQIFNPGANMYDMIIIYLALILLHGCATATCPGYLGFSMARLMYEKKKKVLCLTRNTLGHSQALPG